MAEQAAKVHGRATVGIGVQQPESLVRMIARADRLRDALTRAEGDRKVSLAAELARIDEGISKQRPQVEALVKSMTAALAATAQK